MAPRDNSRILFAQAQGVVDAIWREMGLYYPPSVESLPARARCRLADADRLRIRLPPETPSWCVLHELAHAMSCTHDGLSDGHGPRFMGIYMRLLERYLRLDRGALLGSLVGSKIAVDAEARPIFCD